MNRQAQQPISKTEFHVPPDGLLLKVSGAIQRPRHYFDLISPVTERSRYRGKILKGGRIGDEYFVCSPQGGLVKVWVEPEVESSFLCVQPIRAARGPARQFLKEMGWNRILFLSLLLPAGILIYTLWGDYFRFNSLMHLGVVLIEIAIWRWLSYKAKDQAELRVLNDLTVLFLKKGEVSREDDDPLTRHRLDVMERIKREKAKNTNNHSTQH